MCVARLGRVTALNEKTATVDFGGVSMEARSGLVRLSLGDNVLVHAGIIIQTIKEEEAEDMRSLMQEMEGNES